MTREDAIKMINAHKFPSPMEEWQKLNNEAIDMAIEALSKPKELVWNPFKDDETEPSVEERENVYNDNHNSGNIGGSIVVNHNEVSDLISRAEAIKALASIQKYNLDERNRLEIYAPWHKSKRIFAETEAIFKTIYTLPSVSAECVVRCKDCDNRHTDDCPMYHEEWYEIDEGDGYFDSDFTVHDYSQDDGFCSMAKMKGDM